jgi:spermidine synthase
MLQFNLKKREARKELYYKKDNFISELGVELINKKTEFILRKPNSSILSDERLKIKDSTGKNFIFDDINFFLQNKKIADAFICNFDLQIPLAINSQKFFESIYENLNTEGFFSFNLLTVNSFITLQKIFLEIDDNVFNGAQQRFGPFHDTSVIITDLNKSKFKEVVVSTEQLELNYKSLDKIRADFKELGISNYYNEKIRTNKNFYKKTTSLFKELISKHDHVPIEIEISTFTSWK